MAARHQVHPPMLCHHLEMRQLVAVLIGVAVIFLCYLNREAPWTKDQFSGFLVWELGMALGAAPLLAVLGNAAILPARASLKRSPPSSEASYRSWESSSGGDLYGPSEAERKSPVLFFAVWIALLAVAAMASSLATGAAPFNGLHWEEPGWPDGEPQWLNMLRGVCLLLLPFLAVGSGATVAWIGVRAFRGAEFIFIAILVWVSAFVAILLPGLT